MSISKMLAAVAIGAGALGLAVGPAFAGGQGAQTFTAHAHGTDAAGVTEIDFVTQPAPPLPDPCWFGATDALVSTDGNAIIHAIGNKTGFWLTTTYAGAGAVYPLVLVNGQPVPDPNNPDNHLVDMSGTPVATGRLTTWFGIEDNNKNDVIHATVSFRGTDSSGNPVSLRGHIQLGTNAAGTPTVTLLDATCS